MKFAPLALLLLTGCSQPSALRVTTHDATPNIEITPYGNCAVAHITTAEGSTDLGWQACHGWEATQCGSDTLLISHGVRASRAHLLRGEQLIDLGALLDAELAQTGEEYLHLDVEGRCGAIGLEIDFNGSRIGRGQGGRARPLIGRFDLTPDAITIEFEERATAG